MKKYIFIFILITFVFTTKSWGYWIWTPKSGKWVNPKYSVKPSTQEQLKFAEEFYKAAKYEDALREFKKLMRFYPRSFEAAESQFYIGLCLENLGRLYDAYLAYQKVMDKYPFSERISEIVDKEYRLAERFISGEKLKSWGITLPVENPAIEILRKVIENAPYGKTAPIAQYKLGLVLKGLGRYQEAKDEFDKVISNYPQSEWVSPAKFQLATCSSSISQGIDYDQQPIKEAKERFEEFLKANPEAELSKEAEEKIEQLKEKEAESNFKIGQFYEKQKAYESAKVYYRYVTQEYPKSTWAIKALERLVVLERK